MPPTRRQSPSYVGFNKADLSQCIASRFETIVDRFHDRVAVSGRTRLTYGQLNRTANRIAAALLARDEPGEERVGLLVDDAAQSIPAILGAVKAGYAYVPLDRSHPRERLASIIA